MLDWLVSSSVLTASVLLLRALLKNHISAGLRYAMWLVVLLRLLIPVSLYDLPVGGMDRIEAAAALLEEPAYIFPVQRAPSEQGGRPLPHAAETDTPHQGLYDVGYVVAEDDGETLVRYLGRVSPAQVLSTIWIAGSALAALVLLGSNLRFLRSLRRSRRGLDVRCRLPVYLVEGLPSPCLFGLLRPAIYLTESALMDAQTLRYVLLHEQTHFRHGDHFWCAARCAALAVHWWNPLVWAAVACSRQDAELSCDESAMSRLRDGERRAYGETLLHLVTAPGRVRDMLSCATTMTGGMGSLTERIRYISCKRKYLVCISVLAVFLLSLSALYSFGRAEERSAPEMAHSAPPVAVLPAAPEEGIGTPVSGELVQAAYEEITADMAERPFTLTVETAEGERHAYRISTRNGHNVEHVGLYFPVSYDWYSAGEADWKGLSEPGGGLVLTIFDDEGNIFRSCAGSDVVCLTIDGQERYLRAEPRESEEESVFATGIFAFVRMIADDAARSQVWDSAAVDSSASPEEAARLLARQVAENYAALPGWVAGKPLAMRAQEATDGRVFDVYWGDPAQFCCEMDFQVALSGLLIPYWQAGAGLSEPERAEGMDWYAWGRQCLVTRDDATGLWSITDKGTGGYRVSIPGYSLSHGTENYLGSAPVEELVEMILLTEGFTHDYLLPMLLLERPDEDLRALNSLLSRHTEEEQSAICTCLGAFLTGEYAAGSGRTLAELAALLDSQYHKYLP